MPSRRVPLMDDPRAYTAVALRVEPLAQADLVALIRRAQAGDDAARKRAIETNLRLVFDIAQAFQRADYTLADSTQDGVVGLATAIDQFDCDRGWQFSTFAFKWIWQAIQRGVAHGARGVRFPVHIEAEWLVIRHTIDHLTAKHHGRVPTTAEVAAFTSIPAERIELVTNAAEYPLSLQARLGSDKDSESIGDYIEDAHTIDPSDAVADADEHAWITQSLHHLDETERLVLTHRFGLANHDRCDLQATARRLDLERAEIRRIERRALQKLQAAVA